MDINGNSLKVQRLNTPKMLGVSARLLFEVNKRRYSLNSYENMRSLASDNIIDRIYGDTLIRDEDGQDSPFQFVINRARFTLAL